MNRINAATFDRMLAERGLSVTEFCKLSGVSPSTVAKIHRGDPLEVRTIQKIADFMSTIAIRPGIGELLEVAS